MTQSPQNYPLTWPSHRPRTKPADRRRGDFVANSKAITLSAAVDKLDDQIERLGGHSALLSSNIELKMDGRPRADRAPPADPGVCIYFVLKAKPMAMACDTFTTVQQNVAAIANHIDAVRRQARYGVASAEESLQAFEALPAPPTWWARLGVSQTASKAEITAAYRRLAPAAHPDQPGGSQDEMAALNAARDEGMASANLLT